MNREVKWAWGWACAGVMAVATAGTVRGAPVIAAPADGFVDSIGVNIHATHYLGFSTTSYDDWNSVVSAIGTLGVRNVRDHIFDTARLNQVTAATGAKVTAIIEQHGFDGNSVLVLDPTKLPSLIALAKGLAGLGALEGPSEYDQYKDPNWQANLKSAQMALYNSVRSDAAFNNVPVIGPAIADNAVYQNFSDLAAYADRGNVHSYPSGFATPTTGLNVWLSQSNAMVGAKSTWSTETGYVHAPTQTTQFYVSLNAAAKYIPRLLMDYHNAGVEKTFLYELLDDNVDPTNTSSENHFGLFDTNYALKPAGAAVKNLIALLSDPGNSFAPASLDYTLTGGNSNLRQALFQKHDGTFWLALWQDVSVFDNVAHADLANADLPVTLSFASPFLGASTYLPDSSTSAVGTYGAGSLLNLNVPDQVLLVQISVPEPGVGLVGVLVLVVMARRWRSSSAKPPP